MPAPGLKSIDTGEAKKVPGVVAVLTAGDLRTVPGMDIFLKISRFWQRMKLYAIVIRWPFVAAETEKAAYRAVNLIKVEYDALPFETDPF